MQPKKSVDEEQITDRIFGVAKELTIYTTNSRDEYDGQGEPKTTPKKYQNSVYSMLELTMKIIWLHLHPSYLNNYWHYVLS